MVCIFRLILVGKGAVIAFLMVCVSAWPDELGELRSQLQTLEERFERLKRARARNRRMAPAAAVQAGARPRTWKLPGTNTSMEIGGYAKLQILYDINAPRDPFDFWHMTERENTPGGNRQGHFLLHARETRFFIKTWTPTDYGTLHTRIEGDFFGAGGDEVVSNSDRFRVRRAFGSLGPLLAGQDFSTFMILDAFGEVIDNAGPVGTIFARQGLVRYTHTFGGGIALDLAVENPDTAIGESFPDQEVVAPVDITVPAFLAGTAYNGPDGLPDFVIRLRHRWSSGGAGIAAVFRQLQVNNGGAAPAAVAATAFGWGVNAGVGWRFNRKRTAIGGSFYYMRGAQRYGQHFPAAVLRRAADGTFDLKPVESYGGTVWVQHHWTDTVRTNFVFGRLRNNVVKTVGGKAALEGFAMPFGRPVAQDMWSVHANIIWRPTPQVDIGAEYVYFFGGVVKNGFLGVRRHGGNAKMHTIQVMFRYWFMEPF